MIFMLFFIYRCKITSATCTCTPRVVHLFWCEHVVALALYRIHKPFSFDLRIPISGKLNQLIPNNINNNNYYYH